jgi:ribosomal-protein-alanine N-acetyltransferase
VNVHIRPATAADVSRILSLEQQSATAGHWTEEQYRQAMAPGGPERLVLVAEESLSGEARPDGGQDSDFAVVGFLVAHHLASEHVASEPVASEPVASEWELENIVVSPTARRRGLGKRLLDRLFAFARQTSPGEAQGTSVFLEVRQSNAAARTLYERVGFQQIGRRKSYYKDPSEDAILYRRNLP